MGPRTSISHMAAASSVNTDYLVRWFIHSCPISGVADEVQAPLCPVSHMGRDSVRGYDRHDRPLVPATVGLAEKPALLWFCYGGGSGRWVSVSRGERQK